MSNYLSNDLISQFAKATVGGNESKTDTTLRGTITRLTTSEGDEGVLCVKLDGSDIETPVSRIPSTITDFAENDRVEVTVKNHALTITGNTTNRAIGIMTEGSLRSEISQTADKIKFEVSDNAGSLSSRITILSNKIENEVLDENNGLASKITQTANEINTTIKENHDEFTTFKQTVEGWEFTDENGSIVVKDGAISWRKLASDAQEKVTDAQKTADSASTNAASALATANNAQTAANTAYALASKVQLPNYLKTTYIDSTAIMSPAIIGGTYWAVEDTGSYLQMASNGIEIYEANITEPKVSIINDGDFVQMILGAGVNNAGGTMGRFYIDKNTNNTSVYYRSGTTNGQVGFTFNDNGTITVHGSMSGVTSSATVVWG